MTALIWNINIFTFYKHMNFTDQSKLNDYVKIKLYTTNSMHLVMKGSINGYKTRFILDSGASNSCVDHNLLQLLNMVVNDSIGSVTGAGSEEIKSGISAMTTLRIGRWILRNFSWVVIDLSHINIVMNQLQDSEIHGVIGNDILIQYQALIDYSHNYLYLKKRLNP